MRELWPFKFCADFKLWPVIKMHYYQKECFEKLFYKDKIAIDKYELTDFEYNINHVIDHAQLGCNDQPTDSPSTTDESNRERNSL